MKPEDDSDKQRIEKLEEQVAYWIGEAYEKAAIIAGQEIKIEELEKQFSNGFYISAEQFREALTVVKNVWKNSGYHTFQYWRNSEAGLSILGDLLTDFMDSSNTVLFRDTWNSVSEEDPR